MSYQNLLNLAFFQPSDIAAYSDHRSTYDEARVHIVDYAHSSLAWSEKHTGLTIVKAELTIMIELNASGNIAFAKGLLLIVEGMLRKLELTPATVESQQTSSEKSEEFEINGLGRKLFKGQVCHLYELISLVLKAVYPDGCTLIEKQYIIKGMHRLLGWEYDGKKWQNAKDGIRKRTPEGTRVVYYLDKIVDKLNDELAA
ncbi:MAG: hypothetical protein NC453_28980 [Muribaculum sp.]|nr:hypothetical protein [Muribaculum sp.]